MKLMKQKSKKQVLFFSAVLFSISLGIIIPLYFSQAFIAESIGMYVGGHIIAAGLQFVLIISNLILGLAGVVLNWVLSPYFMSLPYTHGGIVEIGWPIVRDFINMFFILALVVIGLATALRLKEYQAQKALPVLIIIAILINFTPVICGLIVDASNILMNFFLEEISGLQIAANVFSAQGSALSAMWDDMTALNFGRLAAAPLILIAKTLIMIIFSLVTAFILFMYALLFIMRYIMIWVLVIVSPIAFFSRIFPKTQKGEYLFKSILGWDEWWKQFTEWTLIGITAAFFLYLGEQLMVVVSAAGFMPGIPPESLFLNIITAPIIEFMNVLLPWGVVLAFLFIGWMVAMDTKALGAKMVTGTFKKMGKAIGTAAVVAAPSVMAGMAGGAGKGFQAGFEGGTGFKKLTGAVAGGFTGGLKGGFTKQGRKDGTKWYKEKIIPPNSIREKVYGGLKESLIGEIGGPGVKAAAKKWGVSEWFGKEGKKPEMPEPPEPGATEEEWREYVEERNDFDKEKKGKKKPSKAQTRAQTTLGQFSKPTEEGEKETTEEKEWREVFKENPKDLKKLDKLINTRKNLTYKEHQIEETNKKIEETKEKIQSSEITKKTKKKAENEIKKRQRNMRGAEKKAESIRQKITKMESELNEAQEKIKIREDVERDLAEPTTPPEKEIK